MHNTEDPVPRNGEGRRRRPTAAFRNIGVGAGALGAGAGVGYAGYKVGKAAEDWRKSSPAFVGRAAKAKAKGALDRLLAKLPHATGFIHRHFLQARLREIQLAAGDYARKYLHGEPLLARKGEEGYDPNVEREVKAALVHRRQKPLTPEQEARVGRRLRKEATTLKSGYSKIEVKTGGKRFMPMVQIFNPFKKIRAGMSAQKAGLTHVPKPGEPPPPEMLGPWRRPKTPLRGGEYEGVDLPHLWDPAEAAKESKITYMYPGRQHPHQKPPLSSHEVSVKAREMRDPIASHYARVKAGQTPSMVRKREKPIMGLPSRYLPRAQEVEEQRQAQSLRDYLAGRLKTLRSEAITPLRAQARKQAGRAPLKPLGKTKIGEIRSASETMGDLPVAEGTPFRKPGIKEGIPIGGKRVHPAVVQRAQKELHSAVGAMTAAHTTTAEGIRKNIHDRLQQHFAKAQHGRLLRDTATRLTNETFSHNRTSMEDWEVKALAEHTGTKPSWIERQHKSFVRHTHLGTTQAGEDKIRRAITHRVFAGVPLGGGPDGPVKASYPILSRLGKRTAIGAGVIGALGIGAYGGRKLMQRRRTQETRFAVPGAVRRIQSKLKGWHVGKVGKHELILGGALAGGITAADALTSAVFPDPDKTRKESAWSGAKRGAVYGTALAGAEPLIRIPLSKRFKLASKLKEIRFNDKDKTFVRDVAVGGVEGGLGYLATDKLLKKFAPKTTGGKFAAAAAVGGLATGTIGYGLNRLLRAKRKQQNPTLMAAKLRELRFAIPLGVVKRTLREMKRKSGASIIRGGMAPGYIAPGTRLQKKLIEAAGMKEGNIYMPRFSKDLVQSMPPAMKMVVEHPALTAIHETGHALDPAIHKKNMPGAQLMIHPVEHRRTLAREITANKIAQRELVRAGATPSHVAEWRKRAHKQMSGGYRWPFITVRAGGMPHMGSEFGPTISEAKSILKKTPWLRKKNMAFANRLKEIQFQDWADIPSPGRRGRRLTVAQDRYKKVIREREIQRKEANLGKSALAGAALAGAVHHKTGIPFKRSLGVGAVAGLGAQTALLLRGRKTRDPYGEESIASKRIERLPYQVGGVATAGVLGRRLYKHLKFDSRGRLIRFQQFIPVDSDQVPWHVREASRWIKHPQTRVEHAQKWIGRAQRIRRDVDLPRNAQGKVVDERGRVRQAEWKKDWFKRSVYGGAAVGALLGAKVLHGRIKASAVTAAGLMEKGFHPSQGERLALNIASGNVTRAARETFRGKFPRFARGTKALGGLGQELKQAKENILARANVAIEGKTGRITKASIKRKKGQIVGVDVENPAQAREHLAKIQAEEEKINRRAAQLQRQREKARRGQGTRGSLEEIIKPPPEANFRSKLKTIHFDEVYVRPHTRSGRRQKYKTERKDFREGLLIGGGIGLGGLGVGGGLTYKGRQDALRRKFNQKAEARLAKRVAQELKRFKGLHAKLNDIIEFKQLPKEERRARWGAAAGGITGATSGGILGAYVGSLHPETVGAYTGEAMKQGLKHGMESMEEEIGEGWKPPGYGKREPFGRGAFGPAEAKARRRLLERKAVNRKVLRRLGKFAGVGALGLGTVGAASGYAASKAGTHHQVQRSLSAILDDIISFK